MTSLEIHFQAEKRVSLFHSLNIADFNTNHSVTMLRWNKTLWLDVPSHILTIFNQSDGIISAKICLCHQLLHAFPSYCLVSNNANARIQMSTSSYPVWPDLEKFHHFGKKYKFLAILWGIISYLAKSWTYLGNFLMLLGICLFLNWLNIEKTK